MGEHQRGSHSVGVATVGVMGSRVLRTSLRKVHPEMELGRYVDTTDLYVYPQRQKCHGQDGFPSLIPRPSTPNPSIPAIREQTLLDASADCLILAVFLAR